MNLSHIEPGILLFVIQVLNNALKELRHIEDKVVS